MKVKYKGKRFELRAVTPFDFIEGQGIPFGFFTVEKKKMIWEQVEDKTMTNEEIIAKFNERQEVMKKVLRAGVVTKTNIKYLVEKDPFCALFLYSNILSLSAPHIKKILNVPKNTAVILDLTAKRYCCRPSDIVCPEHNALEKAIFDTFVCCLGLDDENAKLAESVRKMKAKK